MDCNLYDWKKSIRFARILEPNQVWQTQRGIEGFTARENVAELCLCVYLSRSAIDRNRFHPLKYDSD